tara:strand:- start:1313 stop:2017 length:705 start_codon:yes stop_codon:yes gene_type:complete
MAHAKARDSGTRLTSWQDEVLAAREVRRAWPNRVASFPPDPLEGGSLRSASEAAELLEARGLDGRDLGPKGHVLRKASLNRLPGAVLAVLTFALLFPFALTSLGVQITLGRLLGDSTDEGLDARTSFQFLAAFFGSMLVWPVVAAAWTFAVWYNRATVGDFTGWGEGWLELFAASSLSGLLMIYLLCFPIFWASGKAFAAAWDVWVDSKKAWIRARFPADKKAELARLLGELTS